MLRATATQGAGLPKPPGFVPPPLEDRQATLWKQAQSVYVGHSKDKWRSLHLGMCVSYLDKVTGNHFNKKMQWNSYKTTMGLTLHYCWRKYKMKTNKTACRLSRFSRVQRFATPWTTAPRLLCPWGSPGKNTGVGCHVLLQCLPGPGIFPAQGSNTGLLCLLHRQAGSLPLAPLALNKSCLQLCNKVHLQSSSGWTERGRDLCARGPHGFYTVQG